MTAGNLHIEDYKRKDLCHCLQSDDTDARCIVVFSVWVCLSQSLKKKILRMFKLCSGAQFSVYLHFERKLVSIMGSSLCFYLHFKGERNL